MTEPGAARVHLLADRPDLIEPIGLMRWREWGNEGARQGPQWWIDVTESEAGAQGLPVTWVAVDATGAVGAVGLGEYDIEERRDRSPWVLGMIVREDRRRRGIGRLLLAALEHHARSLGYECAWVATGDDAGAFYATCGWNFIERLIRADEDQLTNVLQRTL